MNININKNVDFLNLNLFNVSDGDPAKMLKMNIYNQNYDEALADKKEELLDDNEGDQTSKANKDNMNSSASFEVERFMKNNRSRKQITKTSISKDDFKQLYEKQVLNEKSIYLENYKKAKESEKKAPIRPADTLKFTDFKLRLSFK